MDYICEWKARKSKKMAELSGPHVISVVFDPNHIACSNELDHIPLFKRRQLLQPTKPPKVVTAPGRRCLPHQTEAPQQDSQGISSSPSASSVSLEMDQNLVKHQADENLFSRKVTSVLPLDKFYVDRDAFNQHSEDLIGHRDSGLSQHCNRQCGKLNTGICSDQLRCSEGSISSVGEGKVNSLGTCLQNSMMMKKPAAIKVEYSENLCSASGSSMNDHTSTDMEELTMKIHPTIEFEGDVDHIILKERQKMLLSRKVLTLQEEPFIQGMPIQSKSYKDSLPVSTNSTPCSTLLNLVKLKPEPLDSNELCEPNKNAVDDFYNMTPMKQEMLDGCCGNKVTEKQLQDYMKQHATGEDFGVNIFEDFQCLRKVAPVAVDSASTVSETSYPIRIIHSRKRKKTATDSAETALEEDAPGLLQVLLDQGVSVDEIKLYGQTNGDEPIDESLIENGFPELEAVMSKLFFQRSSLLKFAPVRCSKGSKPSYCLACLFSLVEQARYLQFRSWPAEWGWCRDLQSFIFVFERHHRIVLERPEYGYATYFFELVDSLSIDWQIKRLVTAMKLTSCGRITLIENKALSVGEDITEGEAQVLMQFGWKPNSGLGTMLNYRDRVVHDRKNEKDTSEWRSKIGKLLMDGYNGGIMVSHSILADVMESKDVENPQIKVEH